MSPRYFLQGVVTLWRSPPFSPLLPAHTCPLTPFSRLTAWEQQLQLSAFCSWNSASKPFEGVLKMKTSGSWQARGPLPKASRKLPGFSAEGHAPGPSAARRGWAMGEPHTGERESLAPWGQGPDRPRSTLRTGSPYPFKGSTRKMTQTQKTDRATARQAKCWLVDKRDAREGKQKQCVGQTSACQLRDPAFPTALARGFGFTTLLLSQSELGKP